MRRILTGVLLCVLLAAGAVAVLACGGGAGAESLGWMESFDQFGKYPAASLPSPWEGDAGMGAYSGIGFGATAAVQGQGRGWGWGHACRPIGDDFRGGDTVVARVFLPAGLDYRQVRFGLTTGKSPSEKGGFSDGARAEIYMQNSSTDNPEATFNTGDRRLHVAADGPRTSRRVGRRRRQAPDAARRNRDHGSEEPCYGPEPLPRQTTRTGGTCRASRFDVVASQARHRSATSNKISPSIPVTQTFREKKHEVVIHDA